MGRQRKQLSLDVYVASTLIGKYSRRPNGATEFRYSESWLDDRDRAFPISLSIPLSSRTYSNQSVQAYFGGLLPDSLGVRKQIAQRESAVSAKPFDLLAAIGRDCVGALRFVPEGEDPGDAASMTSRPISDQEIARRIENLAFDPLGMRKDDEDFRISLAGAQEKTAFLWHGRRWHIPVGATPTSHIFKPPMGKSSKGIDFSDSPWNELLCLEFCKALSLDTAHADVLHFGNEPVIVVERFDRRWKDGILYRIPQEDMCQALGIAPEHKYQDVGSPSAVQILELLGTSSHGPEDQLKFMQAMIAFWLLSAIDGHAKNFSIFLEPGNRFYLTPLYDVMTSYPYRQISDKKAKLAMSLGDNNHYPVHQIQIRHFYQTAIAAGLKKAAVNEVFHEVCEDLDGAIDALSDRAQRDGAPASLADSIVSGIERRRLTLKQAC